MHISNDEAAEAISEQIKEKFGHIVSDEPMNETKKWRSNTSFFDLEIQDNLGIFDMVLSHVWLAVSTEPTQYNSKDAIKIHVGLHSKRSEKDHNVRGETVGTFYFDESWNLKEFEPG